VEVKALFATGANAWADAKRTAERMAVLAIILFCLFVAKGAKIYGMTSQEGYDHVESKAVYDDKFCGLMCDEDNQYDMSEDRAKAWVTQLKDEGFF